MVDERRIKDKMRGGEGVELERGRGRGLLRKEGIWMES